MTKTVVSPEDKEASRLRLKESQHVYHHHAQDLVDSFHSTNKSLHIERHTKRCTRQEDEALAAEAKLSAEAAAAAHAAETANKQKKKSAASKSSSSGPRQMWRKTFVMVQREKEARESRQARESMTRVKGFGGISLL